MPPGTGATKKARLWAYVRDDSTFGGNGPPMVAYRFEDSRSDECVRQHLGGSRGMPHRWTATLPATSCCARTEAMTVRGWRDAGPTADGGSTNFTLPGTAGSPPPRWSGGPICGSSRQRCAAKAETRAAARQAVSAPIVAGLFTLWQQTLPRISGKSKLAEAIRYALTRRATFECFLTDGLVELDSNIVERAIRPQTITRKNSLSAGSDGASRHRWRPASSSMP